MKPQILKNLDEAVYHSQGDLDAPHFSASYAKMMVQKSPYHVYYAHPKLGAVETKDTDALSFGREFHAVMAAKLDDLVVVNESTYKTKRAQETRDSIISDGKVPALELAYAMRMAAEKQLAEILPVYKEDHENEISVRYEVNGVKYQSRFDAWYPQYGLVIDWKTTTDANPKKCVYDITKFRYDMQDHVYKSACKEMGIENPRLIFGFIEKDFPHAIFLKELSEYDIAQAELDVEYSNQRWLACLEKDAWPCYGYEGPED